MNIKIDDKKTVFFVILLLKIEKEIPGIVPKKVTNYDIYTKLQKTAKSVPEAIQMTVKEAEQKPGYNGIASSSAALLTPEIFLD